MYKYRYFSLLLTLLFVSSIFTFSTQALETSPSLINTLGSLYDGDLHLYTIKDKDGIIITESFYNATNSLYMTKMYSQIEEYVNANVSEIEYRYYTNEVQLYSGDIAKSQTSRFIVLRSATEGQYYDNTQVRVSYDLSGTIYYDPNTAKISTASNPTLSNFSYEMINGFDGDGNYHRHSNNHYRTIASDKYSASFTSNFIVRFEATVGLTVLYAEYAPISNTLTIAP